MTAPNLTFACELEPAALKNLMTDQTIQDLADLGAALSLAILDFSQERVEVVRRLNTAGVPVIAWLLLPKDQGYWLNIDNAPQALACYQNFAGWAQAEGLHFSGIGLDVEPDIRDFAALRNETWRRPWVWLKRFFRSAQLRQAQATYRQLVSRIQADGYWVESYQYPFIADERHARTTLIRRLTGMVDISTDLEVLMLYSSHVRPHGAALIASYGPDAQSIGVGSTGGGVEAPGVPDMAPLSWEELARDLRLAWFYTDRIFIFSLEGCVRSGYLERLKDFVWDMPLLLPEHGRVQMDAWRRSVWSGLWFAERLPLVLSGLIAALIIWRRLMRHRRS